MKSTIPNQKDLLRPLPHKPFYITHPEIIICALLIIINFIIYLQALSFGFVWDDHRQFITNQHIRSGLTLEGIKWAFNIYNGITYWHPLSFLSHMLDIHLFGLNPAGHHLSSILIHTANSLLLFFVFRLMTGSLWRSAFVAALFAIHPLNIESVAWIAERKNVLSTFFWLLTMLVYYRYTQKKSLKRYFLILLVFGLGLLTKPMLVTLPFVLLLLDFWPLNRYLAQAKGNNSNKTPNLSSVLITLTIEKIPLFILSLLAYLVTALSLHKATLDVNFFISTSSIPMSLRISNAFVSYIKYILKLIWPTNLSCYYPFPEAIPLWQVIGSAFLLLLITLIFIKFFKKKPYLLIGWLWFCVTLLPVSGIIQAGFWPEMADRWTYVPFIGLFIIVVWSISDTQIRKYKFTIYIIFSLVIVMYMAATKYYLQFWENDITLSSRSIKVTNNNPLMRQNLSIALTNQGKILQLENKLDDAEQKFIDAIIIFPWNQDSYNGLGSLLMFKGSDEEALFNFKKALEIDPDLASAHTNMGIILFENKNFEESLFHFQEAVRLDPNDELFRSNLDKFFLLKNKSTP